MKTKLFILTISVFFVFASSTFAQVKPINTFYKKHKKSDHATKLSIPAWVIDLGIGIAASTLEDEDEKAAIKMAKKIQKIKLLVIEEENAIEKKEVQYLISKLSNQNFEPLMNIRDGGSNVTFMMREKKDKIKNLLILVSEKDEFIMLSLKTKIKVSDINKLIKVLKEQNSIDVFPGEKGDGESKESDLEMIRA